MAHKPVLITYRSGLSSATGMSGTAGNEWIVGHGDRRELEQQGCTITPLVAATPERVEALAYAIKDLLNHNYEVSTYYAGVLEAMLAEMEGVSDG